MKKESSFRELRRVAVQPAGNIPVPVPFKKAIAFDQQAQIHPLKYIYALAEEWKQLMDQFGPEPKRFSEAVAKELGQERIINVKRFLDELEEQGKQHDWKGEPSKGDKTAAVKKLSFLEKQVAAARVVIERNKPLPQEDADMPAPSVMATEPTSSSVSAADPTTPSVSPEPTVATKSLLASRSLSFDTREVSSGCFFFPAKVTSLAYNQLANSR